MRKTVVVLRIIILEQLRDHISPKMSWDSLHTQVSHKPAGLYVNPWPQMAMSGTGTPLLTTDTNIETSGAGDTQTLILRLQVLEILHEVSLLALLIIWSECYQGGHRI